MKKCLQGFFFSFFWCDAGMMFSKLLSKNYAPLCLNMLVHTGKYSAGESLRKDKSAQKSCG